MTHKPGEFGKVAVLMGGTSAERDISLKSGAAVLQALQRQGVDAHGLDARDDVIGALQKGAFHRVFNMLHGRMGEDGVIQGALELLGLPYTGSGVMASAICMDKLRTKEIWIANGLPTPPFKMIEQESDLAITVEKVGLPAIVKPVHEGSSIGMSRAEGPAQLREAWKTATQYDSCVMAEHWVTGKEFTVAILNGQTLPAICLQTPNVFYDFNAKYEADTTEYLCPCGLAAEQETEIQQLALRAFQLVGAHGWGRVDLMRDENGQPWLIEVNTLPGMTDHSLVPMAARAAGIEFDELVMQILETSL